MRSARDSVVSASRRFSAVSNAATSTSVRSGVAPALAARTISARSSSARRSASRDAAGVGEQRAAGGRPRRRIGWRRRFVVGRRRAPSAAAASPLRGSLGGARGGELRSSVAAAWSSRHELLLVGVPRIEREQRASRSASGVARRRAHRRARPSPAAAAFMPSVSTSRVAGRLDLAGQPRDLGAAAA